MTTKASAVPDDDVAPKLRPHAGAEFTVDAAVERTLVSHFGCLSWTQIKALTINGQEIFEGVKKAFLEYRAKGNN